MANAISPYEFAGSESHTRLTYSRFLPWFDGCSRVIDVATGRGIFLQQLQDRGIQAHGVDRSADSIASCSARGVRNVVQADAIGYLKSNPGHFDGLFCAHLVEHLDLAELEELLRAAATALTSGGIAVFVTPNTEDIVTMSHVFWLDLTHVRPYPVALLARLCIAAGFTDVRTGAIATFAAWRARPRRAIMKLVLGPYSGRENGYVICRAR